MNIRFSACLLAGLLIVLPAQQVAAQLTVTLDDAVSRALVRSPQMAQQEQAVGNASEARRTALGQFLPSLTANSSGSLRSQSRFDPATDRIVTGSSDSYSAGLSASYTIFAGGRRFADYNAAGADVRAAQARRDEQRFLVTVQTKALFFGALREEDLLEVARQRVLQADQNLEIVRRRTQLGEATVSDSLRARLDWINAQQAVLQGEAAIRGARFSLGRQIGEPGPVAPERPADLDPTPLGFTPEEIMTLAESRSPSVIAALEETAAAGASVSAARTAYLPSVSFSTGYDWANQDPSFSGGTTSWSLGLRMSYPIFNGFQRESNVERARLTQRVTSLREEVARLTAREEADAAYQALVTSERAIEIAEEATAVAMEDLRVVRERYEVGAARILDVLISQSAADQASTDQVTARYDYLLARADLEAILGRDL
ncbi:MAG: TolC family protein [Gemmatimonadota bacterium]